MHRAMTAAQPYQTLMATREVCCAKAPMGHCKNYQLYDPCSLLGSTASDLRSRDYSKSLTLQRPHHCYAFATWSTSVLFWVARARLLHPHQETAAPDALSSTRRCSNLEHTDFCCRSASLRQRDE